MRNTKKIIPIIVIILTCIIGISNNVYASNVGVDVTNRDNSRYLATGAGADEDHSGVTYSVDGEQAYCIQAGIAINSKYTYEKVGEIYDARFSWIIYNVSDQDLKQAAIWKIAGEVGYGSYVTNEDQELIDIVARAGREAVTASASNAVANFADGEFTYDRSTNSYVSPVITIENAGGTTINGDNGSAYFRGMDGSILGRSVGSGQYQIIIPAATVTSDMNISVTAQCNSVGQGYGPAIVYGDGNSAHQLVIKPSMSTAQGNDATSRDVHLTAVGDLKVVKYDEHGKAISGVKFRVTGGPDNINTVITTDSTGIAELKEIRIGDYTINEEYVPGNLYIDSRTQNISYHVNSGYTNTITFEAKNDYKRGSSQLNKFDMDYEKDLKGDCKLEGAVYGVYAAEDIYEGTTLIFRSGDEIIQVTTDKNGLTPVVKDVYSNEVGKTLDGLPVGSYYWKELKPSEGFNINGETVPFVINADGTDQFTKDLKTIDAKQGEKLITGRGLVIKYDNDNSNEEKENDTDKCAAEGAVLQIRLISAIGTSEEARNTYTATIDENGFAEFIDEEYAALHPDDIYTIPYGEYELTEIKASNNGTHTYYYINPTPISVNDQHEVIKRIVADEPVPMYLKVIKKDADNNEEVHIAGAQYKIWDCQANKFVSQMISPSGEYIDTFETNDEGYFITPQQLYAGEYIVYEIKAPEGYYLDDEYRLPENEADYGDITKGGVYVNIDKEALDILESSSPSDIKDNLVYSVEISNTPLKAKLELFKKGEKVAGSTTSNVSYTDDDGNIVALDKNIATYEYVGLPNVTYEIYAVNEIKTPDGRFTRVEANQVVDKITTDADGYASSIELYPGEYGIREVETPAGYLVDENIENVVLENNTTEKVVTKNKELSDVRQKLGLTFEKVFDDVNYSNGDTVNQRAVFGVYTKNDIKNYLGKTVISSNKLVDLIEIDGNGSVTSKIDLPEGEYYVKELYVTYPYTLSSNKNEFTLKYNGDSSQEFVVTQGEQVVNSYVSGTITLIKLSSSTVDNIIMNGDQIDTTGLDEKVKEILETIKGKTEDEIKTYFEEKNVKFVAGAKYVVYTDEECKNQLRIKDEETGEFKVAELVTDELGFIKMDKVPTGHYYFKEVEAPEGSKISEDLVEVDLDPLNKDAVIYQALIDEDEAYPFITKKDIFTGEMVPNCTFEITDEDGNILMHSTTNEEGTAYILTKLFENGKKYYYTEIEAPDIYDLNTEPHEFIAEIDENGNWAAEPIVVNNYRKTSTVELTKLDMVDSTPIPNCKFELRSLETDFVVEGVTDENGVYVFKDIPYGKYTYTELEAPEEYLIDTTPHEITIDAEDIKIVVKDERAPDTGDIAVATLAVIAVVCALGIVFVSVKNKKLVK